jgi:hemerythrin
MDLLIEWTEDFSVGVVEIDNQHKKLVKMINELHQAMKQGKGNSHAGDIINQLVDYSIYHFQTEEKYFDKFDYPQTEKHKKIHTDFVNIVSFFKNEFKNNEVMLTIDILNFLSSWLRKHILGDDMEYSDFFIENGLK